MQLTTYVYAIPDTFCILKFSCRNFMKGEMLSQTQKAMGHRETETNKLYATIGQLYLTYSSSRKYMSTLHAWRHENTLFYLGIYLNGYILSKINFIISKQNINYDGVV